MQQIVRSKFPRDFAKRLLRVAQIVGQQLACAAILKLPLSSNNILPCASDRF